MEESKIIFQEDKLLSGQVKLKEDEYLPKECFITNLRIETKENDKKPPIWIQQKQSEWRGIREVKQCPKQRRRKKGADVVDKIHRRDLPKIWNMSTCITTHMIKI
ncbi:hypothetical protein BRARA_H01676 [Brassica rapa]|uniref:Uncharacterized protein n=1 Tax=Brassica campestris TaxID=3711 RepID=A0A397YC07_BRACM|nr:hypothetical protein BRARA_H01676 [Brassica rapa]